MQFHDKPTKCRRTELGVRRQRAAPFGRDHCVCAGNLERVGGRCQHGGGAGQRQIADVPQGTGRIVVGIETDAADGVTAGQRERPG